MVAFSSGPGQSFVFSIFIDSMIDDTGFSRSTISALYMVSTGVSALMVAMVSRLADRWGARSNLILVGVAFGAACFGMAFSSGLAAFYLSFAGLRALGYKRTRAEKAARLAAARAGAETSPEEMLRRSLAALMEV